MLLVAGAEAKLRACTTEGRHCWLLSSNLPIIGFKEQLIPITNGYAPLVRFSPKAPSFQYRHLPFQLANWLSAQFIMKLV